MWFSSNQLDTEEQSMTNRIRQLALAAGSALMALGMVAGVFAATQNQNTSNPGAPFSHGRMGPPGGMFGMPFGPMGLAGPIADRIGLSDAQKAQLKAIASAHQDEFKALAARAGSARSALMQSILADPVSDAAVQQASAGVAAVESDMAVASAHVRAEMFQVLTDDQKASVKQLLTTRGQRRGQ
jgi:Spy/CpxP family protein refolding chaperone